MNRIVTEPCKIQECDVHNCDTNGIDLDCFRTFVIQFLRATAVPAGTAEARISYGDSVCPSVRPSVTARCRNNRVT